MRIAMVTRELTPYTSPDADRGRAAACAAVELAAAFVSQGHEVHAVAPLAAGLDLQALGLARRLRPLAVAGPDGGASAWHRYDGRSARGVEVHLLERTTPEDGDTEEEEARDFCRAAAGLLGTLGTGTLWCWAWDRECAPLAIDGAVLDGAGGPLLRHLLVLTGAGEWTAGLASAVEAHERLVFVGRRIVDHYRDRVPVFGRLREEGRLIEIPCPVPARPSLTAADKADRKAALQLRQGLPVRPDIPLAVVPPGSERVAGSLPRILRQDLQIVVGAEAGVPAELAERYPDRLRLVGGGSSPEELLEAADLALIASDPRGATRAMSRGALPVVAPSDSEGVVDLAPDLSSGSGAIAEDDSVAALEEAFDRALGAFHRGGSFRTLSERIQRYPITWPAAASQLALSMAEPVSESEDPTPAPPSTGT
jgi:hypothetical protein